MGIIVKDPPSWSLTVSPSSGVKAAGNSCPLHPCEGSLPEPHGPGRRLWLAVSVKTAHCQKFGSFEGCSHCFQIFGEGAGKGRQVLQSKVDMDSPGWVPLRCFHHHSCLGTLGPYLEPTCGHEQPSPNQSLIFENNPVWIQTERSWFLFHGPIVLQRDGCFFPASPGSCCCCCSVIKLCLTLCDPMVCSTPGFPVRHQLVETTQTHVHCVNDAIQYLTFFCPLLLPPSIFPSIKIFSNELALCIRWPKYWSFSFSISPSNEYSALISFRMDWLDLLAVQGTLKSLFQHNSKTSVLWFSAFFLVQLSRPHRTTGKPDQDST